MSNTQYAVCHLQRGSGNDSGMSCHIERKDAKGKIYVPVNANADRTHLNREQVRFPEGVSNRTEAYSTASTRPGCAAMSARTRQKPSVSS